MVDAKYQLNGHEFEPALGEGGQGGLGDAVHVVAESRTRLSD